MDEIDLAHLHLMKKILRNGMSKVLVILSWTGVGGKHLHALMPAVLNRSMIEHLREKIILVQDFLKRPLILENPLSPVAFKANEMNECVFLNELNAATNATFALNLSTFYSNSLAQEFDPEARLSELNWRAIRQLKISILPSQVKAQSPAGEAGFDRSVWSLLSLAIKRSRKVAHQFSAIMVRVEDADASVEELFKVEQTLQLFTKELIRGNQNTSGISP